MAGINARVDFTRDCSIKLSANIEFLGHLTHISLNPPQITSPQRHRATRQSHTMGRLHSNGKGISASAIPYSRTPPTWLKTTPDQVVEQIAKLAKKGATPSQIGVTLRDSHGIAMVKVVTGKSICEPPSNPHKFLTPPNRQQNPSHSQIRWSGTSDSRRPLYAHPQGCVRPEASRAQP